MISPENATCLIDGFGPLPLMRPSTVAEVGELIRHARSTRQAVYPVGGQTKLCLGGVPSKLGQAIDLRGLARVIDFPARDMTITVEAGITVRELQELIHKENLRLPIDVPEAGRATLGGILATNISGSRRYGYGTMRDYVIGITALNDDGNEFKAGGRVVKNVAGYDLCKLLIGSLGTLGVITQVTLKLRPLPEQQAVLCLPCETEHLESLLNDLCKSQTRPVCLELMNAVFAHKLFANAKVACPPSPWIVLVGYEGNADAVSWQVQQLAKELAKRCPMQARIDFTAKSLCEALVESAAWIPGNVDFRANLLPSAIVALCNEVDREPHRPALRAHAGNGIVYGHWPGGLTKDQTAAMLTSWRAAATAAAAKGQGSVIVTNCPADWKAILDVWGPPRNDAWLMREVKAKFDPDSIFNPGRFVDGI